MTLLVQKYLETHTLAQLKAEHGVNARMTGYKISLNYDMLEASNTDPIACECRGTILAHQHPNGLDLDTVVGPTDIYARTMPRFFNHGQDDCAAKVDFDAPGTKFYEKLDGTMCVLYYDMGKLAWHVGTRSMPEADLPIDGFENLTFRGLFEKAIKETTGLSFDEWTTKDYSDGPVVQVPITYVFELCTPANRIVVKHDDYKVTLIAAIKTQTGEEIPIKNFHGHLWGVPVCKSYRLNNMKEMLEFVSGRDPMKHEGIVACDENFNRVKVKNAGYLALHRVKDSAMRSPRALVELCLLGKLDDALPLLPDHIVEQAHKIEEALRGFIRYSNEVYMKVGGRAIGMCDENGWDSSDPKVLRKAMALSTQELGEWLPYIMLRYQGQIESFREFINLQIDPLTGSYKKSFLDTLLVKLEV